MCHFNIAAKRRACSSSSNSRLSANYINNLIETLRWQSVRDSTMRNYLAIWRSFNTFLLRLDSKPKLWEDRTMMFCAYLIDKGCQSATIRSYVSGIKKFLNTDNYEWDDSRLLVHSLSQACRLKNDTVHCRFPISKRLLEILLFELERILYHSQYSCILYKAILCLGYYGLMCVGELTDSCHTAKACNIHIGANKDKILVILYSSKTHSKASYPQETKISSIASQASHMNIKSTTFFCPFQVIRTYVKLRGGYLTQHKNFFVFRDRSVVKPHHLRTILRKCIANVNLNPLHYDCYLLRIGRSCDLMKAGVAIDTIKALGCWKSNAVFRYIRQF